MKVYSTHEFETLVTTDNQQYVLLENFILDISQYKSFHPGGTYLLQKTVGTDITKFFYGGYSFETENN